MWKEYPADTRYLVADNGAVRGPRGWILVQSPATGGYLTVNIAGKTKKVASVVAETWLGPKPDGYEVAHIDGNNQNNESCNLEYATKSENERHKVAHGTSNHGERNGRAKLSDEQIAEIRDMLSAGSSQNKVAERFNITQGYVSAIKRGANR